MEHRSTFKTPWGWIEITATEKGLSSIDLFPVPRRTASGPQQAGSAATAILIEAEAQLLAYIEGTRREFLLPLDMSAGTSFQRKVWRTVFRIPYGRVRSYQWVAARVGGKQYARAVGMALGANPIPIIVPCHRIIAQDGSLGGFSCGLPAKRRLLRLEGTMAQLRSAQ